MFSPTICSSCISVNYLLKCSSPLALNGTSHINCSATKKLNQSEAFEEIEKKVFSLCKPVCENKSSADVLTHTHTHTLAVWDARSLHHSAKPFWTVSFQRSCWHPSLLALIPLRPTSRSTNVGDHKSPISTAPPFFPNSCPSKLCSQSPAVPLWFTLVINSQEGNVQKERDEVKSSCLLLK